MKKLKISKQLNLLIAIWAEISIILFLPILSFFFMMLGGTGRIIGGFLFILATIKVMNLISKSHEF